MLDNRKRYLQIAFNYDLSMVYDLLPKIIFSDRILVEAGTPFIKNEGMHGIREIARIWGGYIVADMKIADGGLNEVEMAIRAGANAVTVLGNSPPETLQLVIDYCADHKILSMIDLLGVDDPLDIMRPLYRPPDIMVLHRGRDEENTRGKLIQYRHVNRIRSKYNTLISAAGGVDLKEARSAIFNGANIVVANIVRPQDIWMGISSEEDIAKITREFLDTIS